MAEKSYTDDDGYKKDVASLHKYIQQNQFTKNKSEVERIFCKYPKERYFVNEKVSAAAVAIKRFQFETYKFLLSNNVFLIETMQEIKKDISRLLGRKQTEAKQKHFDIITMTLRKIHDEFAKESTPKHLTTLLSKTKFAFDSYNDDFVHIIQMLRMLNNIPEVEIILKVASTCENLTITLDPQRSSVAHMVPEVGNGTDGLTLNQSKNIYVGVKEWFASADSKHKTLGTLAHELCHYALLLVYENNFKPYKKQDEERKERFQEIVTLAQSLKEEEVSIKDVFRNYKNDENGDVDIWHDELIVTVPQLFTSYINEKDTLEKCETTFKELFDFFRENTLVDLIKAFPLLEAKNELRKINDICGSLMKLQKSEISLLPKQDLDLNVTERILAFSSNCVQMTMRTIYEQLRKENDFECSYIFANLTALNNSKTFELILGALKISTNPIIIIDCDDHKVLLNILENLKISERVILIISNTVDIQSLNGVIAVPTKHSFLDLTTEYQNKLLQRQINFQNQNICLGKITDRQSHRMLDKIPVNDLIEKQDIEIMQGMQFDKNELKIFIERKLLPSNAKLIKFEGSYDFRNVEEEYDTEYEVEEVLSFIESNQTFVIVDEPGMGKSTELKMMAHRLKTKYPDHWIVFIDLKEHYKSYEKNEKVTQNFSDKKSISTFLIQKILKLESFEAEIFEHLLDTNRVILLLDGFDEISPSYEQFLIKLILGIQKETKNYLWITTRLHSENKLSKDIKSFMLKLKPFTGYNYKDYFTKFFQNKNLDSLSLENAVEKANGFLSVVRGKLRAMYDGFIFNPLLIWMIADISIDNDIEDLSLTSVFSIYEVFTSKMIDICMDKGKDARGSIISQMGNSRVEKFYRKQALMTIFPKIGFSAETIESLLKLYEQNAKYLRLEDINRVGLIYNKNTDGHDEFFFFHKTFAEFFIAKLFLETIKKDEEDLPLHKENLTSKLFGYLLVRKTRINEDSYKMILFFVNDGLKSFEFKNDLSEQNQLKTNLKETLSRFREFETEPKFWLQIVSYRLEKLIEMIIYFAKDDFKMFWRIKGSRGDNVIKFAARKPIAFVKNFWIQANELFDSNIPDKIMLDKNIGSENILHEAIRNKNIEVFNFFFDKIQPRLETQEHLEEYLLRRVGIHGVWTLMHLALIESDKHFKRVMEILVETFSKVKLQDFIKSNHCFLDEPNYVWLAENNMSSLCYWLLEIFDGVEEIQECLKSYGHTALQEAAERYKLATFEEMWNFFEVVLKTDAANDILNPSNDDSLLSAAILNSNLRTFEFVRNIFLNIFGDNAVREIIRSNPSNNFLRKAARYSKVDVFKSVWKLTENLLEPEEIKHLIRQVNNNADFGQSPYAWNSTTPDGIRIYNIASKNDDIDTFIFVKEIYQKYFDYPDQFSNYSFLEEESSENY